MLALRVIPCLDVKDGRVVKGVNFVSLRDAGDPVEQARAYDREGADEITFLDIAASHENRDTILDVVQTPLRIVTVRSSSPPPCKKAWTSARSPSSSRAGG